MQQEVAPNSNARKLARYFLAFLGIGAFGSTLLNMFAPAGHLLASGFVVATMFGYYFWMPRLDPMLRDSQQFADSLYYMGFLFTLVSLTISLLLYTRDPSLVQRLIGQNGIALVSTIVGLTLRVWLRQFVVPAPERVAEAQKRLAASCEKLAHRVEATTATIAGVVEAFADRVKAIDIDSGMIRNRIDQAFEGADEALRAVVGSLEGVNSALDAVDIPSGIIRERLETIDVPDDIVRQKLEELDVPPGILREKLDAIEIPEGVIREKLEAVEAPPGILREKLATTLSGVDRAIDRSERGLTRLATHVESTGTAVEGIAQRLIEIDVPKNVVQESINAAMRGTTSALADANVALKALEGSLSALGGRLDHIDLPLREKIEAVDVPRDAIAEKIQAVDVPSGLLREKIEESLEGLEGAVRNAASALDDLGKLAGVLAPRPALGERWRAAFTRAVESSAATARHVVTWPVRATRSVRSWWSGR